MYDTNQELADHLQLFEEQASQVPQSDDWYSQESAPRMFQDLLMTDPLEDNGRLSWSSSRNDGPMVYVGGGGEGAHRYYVTSPDNPNLPHTAMVVREVAELPWPTATRTAWRVDAFIPLPTGGDRATHEGITAQWMEWAEQTRRLTAAVYREEQEARAAYLASDDEEAMAERAAVLEAFLSTVVRPASSPTAEEVAESIEAAKRQGEEREAESVPPATIHARIQARKAAAAERARLAAKDEIPF